MWVRVATFEGVDKQKMEEVMQERMSSGGMATPPGMNSVLILDDTDAKKRKFLAFFDSREALDAAEAGFEQMGETIPEDVRGKRTSVHYYDVPVAEGTIEGAKAARVSVLTGSPESVDQNLERAKEASLSKVRSLDGNVGAFGLSDRENGRTSLITLWDSADSLRASEDEAGRLREKAAAASAQEVANVARYEVSSAQSTADTRA